MTPGALHENSLFSKDNPTSLRFKCQVLSSWPPGEALQCCPRTTLLSPPPQPNLSNVPRHSCHLALPQPRLHSVLMLRDLHHPSHCLRDELQVPRLALPCTLTYPYVPSNSHQVGLACLCTVHACQLPSPILTTPLTPYQGHSATSTSPLGLLMCPNTALPP